MLVNVRCTICGESSKIDIGDMTKDEVEKLLKERDTFQCFGNHVELTSPLKFWVIDWDSIHQGSAPTEEEFLNKLKSKYKEVLTTDELSERYIVKGFLYGMCTVESKTEKEEWGEPVSKAFQFTQSSSGKRYYYTNA
jgi:hypothetical protein